MIDISTSRGRIISATLQLAAERRWADVTLADIADRAGVPLVDLKGEFGSKLAILTAFSGLIDDEVLRRAPRRSADQAARDAIFEVVMCRFDAMQPYKEALRSITSSGSPDPGMLRAVMASQHWMLEAAGVQTDGLPGTVRTIGLASVYASVFRTWLDDADPGHARTMAALDRRLRRGEATLHRIDDVCSGVRRLMSAFSPPSRQAAADAVHAGTAPSTPPPT